MSKQSQKISINQIINDTEEILLASGLDEFDIVIEEDVHESSDEFGVPQTQAVNYIIYENEDGVRFRVATVYDNENYDYESLSNFFASSPYLMQAFIDYIRQFSAYISRHKDDTEIYGSKLSMLKFTASALRESLLDLDIGETREDVINLIDAIISVISEKEVSKE